MLVVPVFPYRFGEGTWWLRSTSGCSSSGQPGLAPVARGAAMSDRSTNPKPSVSVETFHNEPLVPRVALAKESDA